MPTRAITGLHAKGIKKLLAILQKLVNSGNTVVVEHNLDVIKSATGLSTENQKAEPPVDRPSQKDDRNRWQRWQLLTPDDS